VCVLTALLRPRLSAQQRRQPDRKAQKRIVFGIEVLAGWLGGEICEFGGVLARFFPGWPRKPTLLSGNAQCTVIFS